MIYNLTLILSLQLAGEVISRSLGLIVPGPVIGMALFVCVMVTFPKVAVAVRETANALLAHLSLLFVPAGVGVVGHIQTLGADVISLIIAITISTIAALVVAVYTFLFASKFLGANDD